MAIGERIKKIRTENKIPNKIKFEFDYWKTANNSSTSYTLIRYGNQYAAGQLLRINGNYEDIGKGGDDAEFADQEAGAVG